jgi:DNA mismatch repair protein MutS
MDAATRRNLEITQTLSGQKAPTLFSALDQCASHMGSRLLALWLHHPLRRREHIRARQQAVARIGKTIMNDLQGCLKNLADIERIAARIAVGNARPRDLAALRDSLLVLVNEIELPQSPSALLHTLQAVFPATLPIAEQLQAAILPEPAVWLRDGGVINHGYHAELDELRHIQNHGDEFLLALEARERERTGLSTLKVEFNRVHGFYIELIQSAGRTSTRRLYQRRQTLKNAERFITPELKTFEDKVLAAQDNALALEKQLSDDTYAENPASRPCRNCSKPPKPPPRSMCSPPSPVMPKSAAIALPLNLPTIPLSTSKQAATPWWSNKCATLPPTTPRSTTNTA